MSSRAIAGHKPHHRIRFPLLSTAQGRAPKQSPPMGARRKPKLSRFGKPESSYFGRLKKMKKGGPEQVQKGGPEQVQKGGPKQVKKGGPRPNRGASAVHACLLPGFRAWKLDRKPVQFWLPQKRRFVLTLKNCATGSSNNSHIKPRRANRFAVCDYQQV